MKKLQENKPRQSEFSLATVNGEKVFLPNDDLYIPPNALRIFLESFEGPLDLLLYFIRKQNLNILDIDVSEITTQYVQYIELMEKLQFDLAGEYLLMAAYLTEIKSRMMLPAETEEEEEEGDPRAELVRRLQEYERYKTVSMKIESVPRLNRDFFLANTALPEFETNEKLPGVELEKLSNVFFELLERQKLKVSHIIEFEKLSTREKMSSILELLVKDNFLQFYDLYKKNDGRLGLIVSFLALLELVKDSMIQLVQADSFGPIHLKGKENFH
tara:strand:- start:9532 stop:10347 length:816 start_codon:yes stop_codon:yes gene_type:complete